MLLVAELVGMLVDTPSLYGRAEAELRGAFDDQIGIAVDGDYAAAGAGAGEQDG